MGATTWQQGAQNPSALEALEQKAEKEHWAQIARTLKDLIQSDGWECLMRQLEAVELQQVQRLIDAGPAEHDYVRGFIHGMRTAYHMPETIISKVVK